MEDTERVWNFIAQSGRQSNLLKKKNQGEVEHSTVISILVAKKKKIGASTMEEQKFNARILVKETVSSYPVENITASLSCKFCCQRTKVSAKAYVLFIHDKI